MPRVSIERQDRIEEVAEAAIASGPNMLVPWYLILSYAYYLYDESLVSDAFYDHLCASLLDALDQFLIDHHHAHLCDVEALRAGTGHHLREEDYPSITKDVAQGMMLGRYP
jgi:hypothetical protein